MITKINNATINPIYGETVYAIVHTNLWDKTHYLIEITMREVTYNSTKEVTDDAIRDFVYET